jgi:predicted deacetylase
MRFHDGKGIQPHGEYVVAAWWISMVIAQSSRLAKRLDVVIKQVTEFFKPNVLIAFGDLLYPLLQSSIIHLQR